MPYSRIVEDLVLTNTLTLQGSEWDNTLVRNVTIENVDGNGIMLRDVDNVMIENVTIRNVQGDGIKLSTLGSTSNVTIRNSTIQKIGEDGINAGQRIASGVDHRGLQILDNRIEETGLNGGTTGLLHGIYVQSTDFLIKGNHVSNAVDGNGISVRSSGQVIDNFVETTRESGIAYFPDHANGASDHLIIRGNVIVDTGNGTTRTDINLLNVPSGRESEVVGNFTIRDNVLTQTGRPAVSVDSDYSRLGAVVEVHNNQVVSEAAARASTATISDTAPDDAPSLTAPEDSDFGFELRSTGSGGTQVVLSSEGSVVDEIAVLPSTRFAEASLAPFKLELSALNGTFDAELGVDAGRLFVVSGTGSTANAISGSETLVVRLGDVSDNEVGYATIGLVDADPGEIIFVELIKGGTSNGQFIYQASGAVEVGTGIAFDEIRVSAAPGTDFAVDSFVFSEVDELAPVVTKVTGVDLVGLARGRTQVLESINEKTEDETILSRKTFLTEARLDALSMKLSSAHLGTNGLFIDRGQIGIASQGEASRDARQISHSEELIFSFEKSALFGNALSMAIDLHNVAADDVIILEAFHAGQSVGDISYLGQSDPQFDIGVSFDEIRFSVGKDSAVSISGFETQRIVLYDDYVE